MKSKPIPFDELTVRVRELYEAAKKVDVHPYVILRATGELNRARDIGNVEWELRARYNLRDLQARAAAARRAWAEFRKAQRALSLQTDPKEPGYTGKIFEGGKIDEE
jgi:hypothetical protein